MRIQHGLLPSLKIIPLCLTLLLTKRVEAQGNGNPIALRSTPYDEIFPIPNFYPPHYIKQRIQTFITFFFDSIDDKAEAEEILETIWYFSPVYAMLKTVDKMGRFQYAYAEFGDECEHDSGGDEEIAIETQKEAERDYKFPVFLFSDDYFFKLDAWWEILGNTVDDLWSRNQKMAEKICDFRRRGLMCMKSENGSLKCGCGVTKDGVRMVATRGGLCGIEQGQVCDYTSGSRLMPMVHQIEVYNSLGGVGGSLKTCFGNSYCTGDPFDNNRTKCLCWPLITTEVRAKRNAILNKTVAGIRCDTVVQEKILKWEKWFSALTIVWLTIPLFTLMAPHWDDIWRRLVPGYYKYFFMKSQKRPAEKPRPMTKETHDVKMDPEVKRFLDENAVLVDVNDPDYFLKVDAVDEVELDPIERFITVPHCTDKHFYMRWPTIDKLEVWF